MSKKSNAVQTKSVETVTAPATQTILTDGVDIEKVTEATEVVESITTEPVVDGQQPPTDFLPASEDNPHNVNKEQVGLDDSAGEEQSLVPGETLSPGQLVIRQQLNDYVTGMAINKPMTPERAALHQLNLYHTLHGILAQEGQLFVTELDNFLKLVAAHRDTVFSEYYVFRGLENLRLTASQRTVFTRLMTLFINTCDPETRGMALEAIDLKSALAAPLEDIKQQRVIAYFTA